MAEMAQMEKPPGFEAAVVKGGGAEELGRREARSMAEVQVQAVMAVQRPRDEMQALSRLKVACEDEWLQANAEYGWKVSGNTVSGPTIHLMRTCQRLWGNLNSGFQPVAETDDSVIIDAWAWDLETNVLTRRSSLVKKAIERKVYDEGGKKIGTEFRLPNERELLMLVNREGAKLQRGALQDVIDRAFWSRAVLYCRKGTKATIAQQREKVVKALVESFAEMRVDTHALEEYLGHPVRDASGDEIEDLRAVYQALAGGDITWGELMRERKERASASDDAEPKDVELDLSGEDEDRLSEAMVDTILKASTLLHIEVFEELIEKAAGRPLSNKELGELTVEQGNELLRRVAEATRKQKGRK